MTHNWHSWFAYFPVKTPNGWVWLGWVDRRLHALHWPNYYGDGATLITTHYEHRKKA